MKVAGLAGLIELGTRGTQEPEEQRRQLRESKDDEISRNVGRDVSTTAGEWMICQILTE